MDPLAEEFISATPYNYTLNNPISNINQDGCFTLEGLAVQNFVRDLQSQLAMNDHEYDTKGNKISNLGGGEKVDFHHQENGSVKITDRKSGESIFTNKDADVIKGFVHRNGKVNWETIYNEFKVGNGPKRSLMDENHPMTLAMKFSQAASVARNMFVENGDVKGYRAFDFGISGLFGAGTNMTEQMIGSAGVSIYPVGENVVIMLTNTKTPRSLFIHLSNVKSRYERDNMKNGGLAPYSETKQTYIWIESIKELIINQNSN